MKESETKKQKWMDKTVERPKDMIIHLLILVTSLTLACIYGYKFTEARAQVLNVGIITVIIFFMLAYCIFDYFSYKKELKNK